MEKQTNNKHKVNPRHRLFIKVLDKSKNPYTDEFGNLIKFVKWKEVKEVNLGSFKNPNKNVLEVKWEPIQYEVDTTKKAPDFKKIFGDMFGG